MIEYENKKGCDALYGFVIAGIPIGWNEILFVGISIFFLYLTHWCVFFSVIMLASSVGISKESPDFIRIQNAFAEMENNEAESKDRQGRAKKTKGSSSKRTHSKDVNTDDSSAEEDDEEEWTTDRYSFRSGAVYLARSADVLRPKIKGGVLGLLASIIYTFYAHESVELSVLIFLTVCIIITGIRSAFKFGEMWDDRLKEYAETQDDEEEDEKTNG